MVEAQFYKETGMSTSVRLAALHFLLDGFREWTSVQLFLLSRLESLWLGAV